MRKRLITPATLLFFLAPAIGELLSSSAPPAEFFNPVTFTFLTILYGGGALLVRELVFRWRKGWPSVLLLGAAYGIIEEGLMVKSFFDPNWIDIGILGTYGRWAGVNWVWCVELTIYHAFFSIAIPIALVGLIFPDRGSQPWLSQRSFRWIAVLFVLNGIFIYLALTPYRPPLIPYGLAFLLTLGLILMARRMPHNPEAVPQIHPGPPRRSRWFGLTGFLGALGLFVTSWVLPPTGIHPFFTILFQISVVVGVLGACYVLSESATVWKARYLWALVSGALGFFILLSPLIEMDKARPDNASGMTLVGLMTLAFLIWLGWRIRRTVPDRNAPVSTTLERVS